MIMTQGSTSTYIKQLQLFIWRFL